MHLITKTFFIYCCFALTSKIEALICEDNLITLGVPQNITCGLGQLCGRLDTQVGSTSYVGTSCYPIAGCFVDQTTCQLLARSYFMLSQTAVISSCSAGCCGTNYCNNKPLTTSGAEGGFPKKNTYCFITVLALLLINLFIFH